MNRWIKILIILLALVLIGVIGFIAFKAISSSPSDNLLVKDEVLLEEGIPEEELPRTLDILIEGETKIVTNKYDKYRIKFPVSWEIRNYTDLGGRLTVGFDPTIEIEGSDYDGVPLMEVVKYQLSENELLEDWIKKRYGSVSSFTQLSINGLVGYGKIIKSVDLEAEPPQEIEEKLYILSRGNSSDIYTISCYIGDTNSQHEDDCGESARSFDLIR